MDTALTEPFETIPFWRRISKSMLIDPLINYLVPREVMRNFLRSSKSPLLHESFRRPGSWRCMKISYENRDPVDFIDRLALRYGTFPMGLRNRKRLVVRKMVSLIQHYHDRGVKDIQIVAVGAGTGANTIEALASHPNRQVKAHLFDIADDAFDEGDGLKKKFGVGERVAFIKADMRRMKDHIKDSPHILELVGILEYFRDGEILKFLTDISHLLNSESSVLINSIEDAQGMRRFLKRVFDFELIYRSPARMLELLSQAGYGDYEIEREPLKIYSIITAHKKKP